MRDHTWHALSKGSSLITTLNSFPGQLALRIFRPKENMWYMVDQRLTQITPPATTPDQLWERVEAAWSDVPQEHIQIIFESMPGRVAAVISNNGGHSVY
ncbi:transposable element Tcb1 transposase [Trichonephila clavipes]|nr:transposable element Tcb1 transposase [Trichonephila clavipes]